MTKIFDYLGRVWRVCWGRGGIGGPYSADTQRFNNHYLLTSSARQSVNVFKVSTHKESHGRPKTGVMHPITRFKPVWHMLRVPPRE